MLTLPSYESQFLTLFQSGSGYVRRHMAVDVEASDYHYLEIIAIEKARLGMRVDIMPILLGNDPLRTIIYPDSFENKNPDLRIVGNLWEVEKSSKSFNINNLKHAIDEGSKQADFIIVNISQYIDYDFMFRVVKGRFKDHINLKVVEFRYKGTYTSFLK